MMVWTVKTAKGARKQDVTKDRREKQRNSKQGGRGSEGRKGGGVENRGGGSLRGT